MSEFTQSDVVLFVVLAVLIAIVSYFSLRKSHPQDETQGDLALTPSEQAEADAQFDEGFYGGVWHFVDRYFHTKIAGTSYPNSDGSNRAAYIRRCKPLEQLVIQWDKGNSYDDHAKIVKRQSGEVLGFLPRATAAEIHEDFFVSGVTWIGIFKRANHHPETGQIVGAVILLARMTPQKRAQAEKIAEAESGQPVKAKARRAKHLSPPLNYLAQP